MSTRRYAAVLFDLDGTLRANQPEGVEAFVEYAGRVGLALTEHQIKICEREAHRYWASARVDTDIARFDQRGFWVNYNQLLLDGMNAGHEIGECAHRIQGPLRRLPTAGRAVRRCAPGVAGTAR